MKTTELNKALNQFLKNPSLSGSVFGKKMTFIGFSYFDAEMLKRAIPHLCQCALESTELVTDEIARNEVYFNAMDLLDFYSKINLETEAKFIDDVLENQSLTEVDNFIESKGKLLYDYNVLNNSGSTSIKFNFLNLNHEDLEFLRNSIAKVCKSALLFAVEECNEVDRGTIKNYVRYLLKFIHGIYFESEADFLDEVIKVKKKPHSVADFEQPTALVFYSDSEAVDPSKIKEKELTE